MRLEHEVSFASFREAHLRHRKNRRAVSEAYSTVIPESEFEKANREIESWPGYSPTDLKGLGSLASKVGVNQIYYKDESTRFGLGSFKALGAAYAAQCQLALEISRRTGKKVSIQDIRDCRYPDEANDITLVSATDGNHGRALAWGASRFRCKCRIYIHRDVSVHRQAAIESFGATVKRVDGNYDSSVKSAEMDARSNGWFIVSDTSWPGYSERPLNVMAGYGVIGYELLAQLPERISHVFLQAGVGGMAASISAFFRQRWGESSPRIIVVESELADCLFQSSIRERVTPVSILSETVMAGLSCGVPSEIAWQVLREEATDFLTVPDSIVAPTMRLLARPLANDDSIEAGESAVPGLAALIAASFQCELAHELELNRQSNILVIGTEGATDPAVYDRLVRNAATCI